MVGGTGVGVMIGRGVGRGGSGWQLVKKGRVEINL
jgi:hypothetical protein